ncbi:reductive dehalogenase [Aggregatilinea lenta]|uniref:reductive dehalogenase n=1 Tax=Aggregatilinea lenta TaxID=913108 RepID=UPI000E5A2C5D|nr:reductive dehalogenase [Aggregatilinea lenta]
MSNDIKMSRRNFLKNVGMAGVTAGVAGSTGLTLAGEVFGSTTSGGVYRRPWWVREVDEPTTGIRWEQIKRVDASQDTLFGNVLGRFASEEENRRLVQVRSDLLLERLNAEEPGYMLKDQALENAVRQTRTAIPRSFLGAQRALTPEQRGVPRWEGTPDEAAHIVKVALRQMGAASVGIVHLDERTRKLIYAVDADGKRIEFEDVEQAYETAQKRVIPNRAEWVIVYAVQMSEDALRRAPTKIAEFGTQSAYQRGLLIQNGLQEFLHGLGYQGLGEVVLNGLGISPALAVMGGLGELSRQNRVITPEYGPMVRLFKLVTDLPLAADRPIDAGITRFCKTCKKCAEACPPSALSFDTEPGWTPVGEWSNPGHQAWFENSLRCRRFWYEEAGTNCGICFAVCPFTKQGKSFMHQFVHMQIATAPTVNSLTRSMDDAFGYGVRKDPDAWWNLDLPEYGIDTTKGK